MSGTQPAEPNWKMRTSAGQQSLGRDYFIDPEHFATERRVIFQREWILLGHASDFPAGERNLLCGEIAGQPVVIVRQPDGSFRGFHNVCRHRGALLVEEAETHAVRSRLVCPYHGWAYGLDGCFKGAPNMLSREEAPPESLGLAEVAVRTWHGFVLVRLDPGATERNEAWVALDPLVRPWSLERLMRVRRLSYDIAANWKLLFENYSECYHCPLVHPALSRLTSYTSSENYFTSGPVLGGPMSLSEKVASMTLTGQYVGRCLAGLDSTQRGSVFYYTIFPSCFLSLHPDYVMVHRIQPIDCGRTRVECDFFFEPEVATSPGFDPEPAVAFWDQTNRQDWRVCERVQRGAQSTAFRPGPYTDLESVVAAFDRHYGQRMSEGERMAPVEAESGR